MILPGELNTLETRARLLHAREWDVMSVSPREVIDLIDELYLLRNRIRELGEQMHDGV